MPSALLRMMMQLRVTFELACMVLSQAQCACMQCFTTDRKWHFCSWCILAKSFEKHLFSLA